MRRADATFADMDAPLSLREKVPTLSPAIEKVVMKALAQKPQERFPSVQDFADALEKAISLSQQSLHAPP